MKAKTPINYWRKGNNRMRRMEITEYWTGKRHYRKIKTGNSISYKVEGRYLVVRDYWTGSVLQKFNVSKYGSIQFRVVND